MKDTIEKRTTVVAKRRAAVSVAFKFMFRPSILIRKWRNNMISRMNNYYEETIKIPNQ